MSVPPTSDDGSDDTVVLEPAPAAKRAATFDVRVAHAFAALLGPLSVTASGVRDVTLCDTWKAAGAVWFDDFLDVPAALHVLITHSPLARTPKAMAGVFNRALILDYARPVKDIRALVDAWAAVPALLAAWWPLGSLPDGPLPTPLRRRVCAAAHFFLLEALPELRASLLADAAAEARWGCALNRFEQADLDAAGTPPAAPWRWDGAGCWVQPGLRRPLCRQAKVLAERHLGAQLARAREDAPIWIQQEPRKKPLAERCVVTGEELIALLMNAGLG